MTAVLGPIIVLALQFSNALDVQFFRVEHFPETARCSIAGLPDAIWINLAITAGAMMVLLALAAFGSRLRIPRQAPILIAKIVLGFTVAATAWAAIAVPMLPLEVVTGALFEHSVLTLTAIATIAVAVAAHAGR
jgi:hypothetical protein